VETFLDGDENCEPARRLYQKLGFVDVDTVTDPFGNPRCKMALMPTGKGRGGSFHFQYPQYAKWADKETCPVCQGVESDDPPVLIEEMEHSWLECDREAQGCLFGKCHVLSKVHSEHFYDMPEDAMAGFMGDVQKAARALHCVTRAVKINYEIHGNSMPHLHVHLFPRYLDDDFPSGPIDYRKTVPSPYESDEEFKWFIEQMRNALRGQDRG
jgi:diadenosine tetraphosphate (Ap4A) HIT family hydrolase